MPNLNLIFHLVPIKPYTCTCILLNIMYSLNDRHYKRKGWRYWYKGTYSMINLYIYKLSKETVNKANCNVFCQSHMYTMLQYISSSFKKGKIDTSDILKYGFKRYLSCLITILSANRNRRIFALETELCITSLCKNITSIVTSEKGKRSFHNRF